MSAPLHRARCYTSSQSVRASRICEEEREESSAPCVMLHCAVLYRAAL